MKALEGVRATFRAATEFETSMTKLITLVGLSRDEVADLEGQVKELAGETARAPRELAESIFFIESAGLRGTAATDALRLSAQAAAVGMGEMRDIADALTSAMNAYGHDALSAQAATDAMLAAVRAGKMEPRDLASSIGQVLPVAAEMGVSFQEVNAVLATLSKTGTPVTAGVTQLRSAMMAFLKPGEAAAKILSEYGLSAQMIREQIRERGLIETLISLREQFKGNEEELAKVIGRVEGFNAILALTGGHAGDTRDVLEQVNKSLGLTEEAFGEVSDTAAHQFNQAMADLETVGIELASNVLPPIVDLLKEFNSILKDVSPETKALAIQAGLLAVALGKIAPLLIKISKVRFAFAAGAGGPAAVIAGALILSTALEEKLKNLESVKERMSKRDKGIVGTFLPAPGGEQAGVIDFLKNFDAGIDSVGDSADDAAPSVNKFSAEIKNIVKPLVDMNAWIKEATDQTKSLGFEELLAAERTKLLAKAAEDGVRAVQSMGMLAPQSELWREWGGVILNTVPGIHLFRDETVEAAEEADTFNKILQESANLTIIFGNSLGTLIGSLAGAASGFKSLFGKGGGGFSFGEFTKGFKAAEGANMGKVTFGSFLSGFANALPAIGAIAGPIVGLFSKLFKPKWKKLAEESAKIFGQALSEGLAKEVLEASKTLGSVQNAYAANIGDIIQEVGINAQNSSEILRSFHNLLGMVGNGTLDWKDAIEQVDKAFGPLVDHLHTMGTEGSFAIGEMVKRMRELGIVTAEVQDFIKEKASSAIAELGKYFDYLLEKETLTAEEARSALTYMAGAFEAAVAATGSLAAAMEMLGPQFGEMLTKMRETLGENNALLNAMQRYYNFVKENAEVLGALDALGAAFKELAEIGIINKDNINEFAEAFKQQFAEMLASTGDETTALAAMGPQIGMLLEAYRALGVEVPPWLEEIAQKAKEAGASLEPPEGLPDILKDIRDIMYGIAEALGAATQKAKEFGGAMGDIPEPPGVPGGGGDVPGYQHGGYIPANPPHGSIIRVGEREGEYVVPRSKMEGGGKSVTINVPVTVMASGVVHSPEDIARAVEPGMRELLRSGKLGESLQDAVN